MYTELLRSIEGIGIYPVVSLVLFVAVFAAVLVWAARADRRRLDRYAALPFTEASPAPTPAEDELFCRRRA